MCGWYWAGSCIQNNMMIMCQRSLYIHAFKSNMARMSMETHRRVIYLHRRGVVEVYTELPKGLCRRPLPLSTHICKIFHIMPTAFTVQITHNLNNAHVPHTWDTRMLCMSHTCAVRVTRVAFYCCGFTRVKT